MLASTERQGKKVAIGAIVGWMSEKVNFMEQILLHPRVLGFGLLEVGKPQGHSTPLIAQMSPPCGRKRSNITHLPSGDQTG